MIFWLKSITLYNFEITLPKVAHITDAEYKISPYILQLRQAHDLIGPGFDPLLDETAGLGLSFRGGAGRRA